MLQKVMRLLCLVPAVVLLTTAYASAQVHGGLSTASVEEVGAQVAGGYVGITDDYVSLLGQFRYGVTTSFDLGAKAAFIDFESPGGSSLSLNADGKVQILDVFLNDPIDLAIGPEVTFLRSNDVTVWYFGGFVTLSKELTLSQGHLLTPYGRVGLRIQRTEADPYSDSELDAGFMGGAKYALTGYTSLWGEIVIEDIGTGLFAGVQYQIR